MQKILVVDDDAGLRELLVTVLMANNFDVAQVADGEDAVTLLKDEGAEFDLILSDIDMDRLNGLQLLEVIHKNKIKTPVVMMTGDATIDKATKAIKFGAYDFVTKPFDPSEMMKTVTRALDFGQASRGRGHSGDASYRFGKILAESPSTKEICDKIEKIASVKIPLLIHGEAGTGKKLVARVIHEQSDRSEESFLSINCASLPEPFLDLLLFGHEEQEVSCRGLTEKGLIEASSGGTLLLDEVSFLPQILQEKLLEVLAKKAVRRIGGTRDIPVNVTLVGSSNVPADAIAAEGTMLPRLARSFTANALEIKPLRDRREEIIPLVNHILKEKRSDGAAVLTLDEEVAQIFMAHDWPGNTSEMDRVLGEICSEVKEGAICKEHLPGHIASVVPGRSDEEPKDKNKGKSLKAFIRSKQDEITAVLKKKRKGPSLGEA